jgi:3-oxoadipate enol-lactonase
MKDIQNQISDASFELIPNAGHLSNVDQPAAFNAALIRHLNAK